MAAQKIALSNELGLHARASARFVEIAKRFESDISVLVEGRTQAVDGKNIMALLLLEATCGVMLEIETTGADAEQALAALIDLIEQKFGESPDQDRTHPDNATG